MTIENPTRTEIGEVLKKSKIIAVVGLSDKPERTSYMVSKSNARCWIPHYSS